MSDDVLIAPQGHTDTGDDDDNTLLKPGQGNGDADGQQTRDSGDGQGDGDGAGDQASGKRTDNQAGDGTGDGDGNDGDGEQGTPLHGAPEDGTYEAFSAPEGVEITEELQASIGKIASELDLSQAGAQKLLDAEVTAMQAAQARRNEAIERRRDALNQKIAAFKKDPESARIARDASYFIDNHADEETRKLFYESWLSQHPGVVRLLGLAGSVRREGSIGGHSAEKPLTDEQKARRFFGKSGMQ